MAEIHMQLKRENSGYSKRLFQIVYAQGQMSYALYTPNAYNVPFIDLATGKNFMKPLQFLK